MNKKLVEEENLAQLIEQVPDLEFRRRTMVASQYSKKSMNSICCCKLQEKTRLGQVYHNMLNCKCKKRTITQIKICSEVIKRDIMDTIIYIYICE